MYSCVVLLWHKSFWLRMLYHCQGITEQISEEQRFPIWASCQQQLHAYIQTMDNHGAFTYSYIRMNKYLELDSSCLNIITKLGYYLNMQQLLCIQSHEAYTCSCCEAYTIPHSLSMQLLPCIEYHAVVSKQLLQHVFVVANFTVNHLLLVILFFL